MGLHMCKISKGLKRGLPVVHSSSRKQTTDDSSDCTKQLVICVRKSNCQEK